MRSAAALARDQGCNRLIIGASFSVLATLVPAPQGRLALRARLAMK